jgi:hypothetical protein
VNEELYDTYLRAASAASQDERVRLLRQCAAEDFEIVSPFPYTVREIEPAAKILGDVADAMPGGRLRLSRTSPVDAHHSVFRATYANTDEDGRVLSTGLHVVEVAGGRLRRILVFVPAELPALESPASPGPH